jgi:hypothetical protein
MSPDKENERHLCSQTDTATVTAVLLVGAAVVQLQNADSSNVYHGMVRNGTRVAAANSSPVQTAMFKAICAAC